MAALFLAEGWWMDGWKVWVMVILALIAPPLLICLLCCWLWKRFTGNYQDAILGTPDSPWARFFSHLKGLTEATWDLISEVGGRKRPLFPR